MGTVVNVGEGLLNIVAIESLVLFLEPKSMTGVGSAWKDVSTLERSSSCVAHRCRCGGVAAARGEVRA